MCNIKIDVSYCNAIFDSFLCWPPTLAGTTAQQNCPSDKASDVTKFALRRCNSVGRWEGRDANETTTNTVGWTNYTPCYPPEIQKLLLKLNMGGSADMKFEIAVKTRHLEIVGFSISLAALVLSLAIFCYFRSLRNNRTKIHKNLFMAMVIQVMIRLILYIDQALLRSQSEVTIDHNVSARGIDNTPYLCESSYVLLEYARTAMFMWMFIEGLYLHNMVTVTVFQERLCYGLYFGIGWGAPVVMTTIWAILTGLYFGGQSTCWWGYSFASYYWILEGPRVAVILLNFVFLMNIIRVLIMKLRQTHTSEIEQVRKAVRAAVVLLPLLGITNLLHMTEAPLDRTVWEFALWSYTTHFLTSFQGFFIALLYCFLNGEVRTAVSKHIATLMSIRETGNNQHRSSVFQYSAPGDTENRLPRGWRFLTFLRPGSRNRNNSFATDAQAPETRV